MSSCIVIVVLSGASLTLATDILAFFEGVEEALSVVRPSPPPSLQGVESRLGFFRCKEGIGSMK